MNKIIKIISNPKIFVFTIIWLMVLVFFGTIEQKDIGLFASQKKYFTSIILWFYNIPLPGGLLTMIILSINLFSFFSKPNSWRKNKNWHTNSSCWSINIINWFSNNKCI